MMKNFILQIAFAFLVTIGSISGFTTVAQASSVDFDQAAYEAAIATEGQTVVVRFYETWCPSCTAQGRTMETLVSDGGSHENVIMFNAVYSTHRDLARSLGINRRTSMALIHNGEVTSTIVGETRAAQLTEFLNRAQ